MKKFFCPNGKQFSFGFTLVELLVVIGITAALMAVAIPNFRGFSERQRLETAVKNFVTYIDIAKSNAASGVKCGDAFNPSERSKSWILQIVDDKNYKYLPECITESSDPPDLPEGSNIHPDGITVVNIYADNETDFNTTGATSCGSTTGIIIFSNISANTSFNAGSCTSEGPSAYSRLIIVLGSAQTDQQFGIFVERDSGRVSTACITGC